MPTCWIVNHSRFTAHVNAPEDTDSDEAPARFKIPSGDCAEVEGLVADWTMRLKDYPFFEVRKHAPDPDAPVTAVEYLPKKPRASTRKPNRKSRAEIDASTA